jgi:type VII secretion ATPase EccA
VLTAESKQQWRSKDNPAFIGFLNAGLLVWKVWALLGTGNPREARRYAESGLADRDLPSEVHAKLRLARGYALRAGGQREEAMKAFAELHAWVGDDPDVRAALDDPDRVVELVTASSLATRADVWDPTSGCSARDLQVADRERRRDGVRAEAIALLDAQIGMDGVKEQIRRLESKAIMDQKRAAMGIAARDTGAAYIFTGPPGTGKTTMAKALAQLLFGLGVIARPDVMEVGRADLIGEHLGETAPKTNAVISKSLGGLLFIDEAYSLYAQGYSSGDAYGDECVATLLARMENERLTQDPEKKLVVVIAGYEADIDRFLACNEGLPSRFTTRIHFTTYSPSELVQIACAIAANTSQRYTPAAQQRLLELLTELAGKEFERTDYQGNRRLVNGLDRASNARFVRTLTEKAPDIRDDRLVRAGADLDDESLMVTLEAVDVEVAFRETCAVQKIYFEQS